MYVYTVGLRETQGTSTTAMSTTSGVSPWGQNYDIGSVSASLFNDITLIHLRSWGFVSPISPWLCITLIYVSRNLRLTWFKRFPCIPNDTLWVPVVLKFAIWSCEFIIDIHVHFNVCASHRFQIHVFHINRIRGKTWWIKMNWIVKLYQNNWIFFQLWMYKNCLFRYFKPRLFTLFVERVDNGMKNSYMFFDHVWTIWEHWVGDSLTPSILNILLQNPVNNNDFQLKEISISCVDQ